MLCPLEIYQWLSARLLMHWRYCSLALSCHIYVFICLDLLMFYCAFYVHICREYLLLQAEATEYANSWHEILNKLSHK